MKAVKKVQPVAQQKAKPKGPGKKSVEKSLTAKACETELRSHCSAAERKKYERYFSFSKDKPLVDDEFIGVRMGTVFTVAKGYIDMPVEEIEKLMESDIHEFRAAAMSIMGKSASVKRVTPERLKELYELYIRRHDRINSWDLVDLASHYVVGRYLLDKPRKILYQLAQSSNKWERRTAILSTAHFIRNGESKDTFRIATVLLKDDEDTVHKAVGWMLRFVGDAHRDELIRFLEKHAAKMPRIMLRNSIEHFSKKERAYYLELK